MKEKEIPEQLTVKEAAYIILKQNNRGWELQEIVEVLKGYNLKFTKLENIRTNLDSTLRHHHNVFQRVKKLWFVLRGVKQDLTSYPLREAIVRCLNESNKPLKPAEIAEKLKYYKLGGEYKHLTRSIATELKRYQGKVFQLVRVKDSIFHHWINFDGHK